LQPDRLAEYHAAVELTGGDEEAVAGLLVGVSAAQQAQALTVLGRAAIAHANAGRPAAGDAVLRALDLALDQVTPDAEALQATVVALPYPSRTVGSLALRLHRELTSTYRRLAQANPDAYEPDLAGSLWATAWMLVQGPENLPLALETVTEAVEIFTRLAAQEPAAFNDRLDAARSTQIQVLEGMGHDEDATALRLQMESTTAEGA